MTEYLKRAKPKSPQDRTKVEQTVRSILDDVRKNRDDAVRRYARQFDKWARDDFRVTEDEIQRVSRQLPDSFKQDFDDCRKRILDFAKRQKESIHEFEVENDGITLGQKVIPVERVGCYVPGGKYPLVASAIMSVGTAREAGVHYVVACAPPRDAQGMYPYTLYALHRAGADEIYHLGGVQAFASMAYGCVGMKPVDMVVGAGNSYVAESKRQLFGAVGIDLLAGPTEILIIADDSADPALVATDLLGQAEHGPDSPPWLVTTSRALGLAVIKEVERQLETLPTADRAGPAWRDNGEVVLVKDNAQAVQVSDQYAPEHLEVMTADDDYFLKNLRNYGSLFVGEESTVAYGDKGVGTNHTLPTSGAARYTGGLSVGKFLKVVTYQRLTPAASRRIAPVIARICKAEGLVGHRMTADVRVDRYAKEKTHAK